MGSAVTSVAGLRSNEREVIALSDRAFRARIRCFEFSARELTDGILTAYELAALGVSPAARKELLERGLWQSYEGGVFMRDYLSDNPTRAEVEARRKNGIERVRRHRNRIVTPDVTPASNALHGGVTKPVTSSVTGGVTSANSPAPPPISIHSGSGSSLPPESSSVSASDLKDLSGSARVSGKKRKTLVPDDWQPKERHIKVAAERGLDVGMQAQRYRNRSHAQGEGYVSHDRGFDNWLISPYAKPENGASHGGRMRAGDLSEDLFAEAARLRAEGQ